MVKIISKKRYKKLIEIENIFNSTKLGNLNFNELTALYNQKLAELQEVNKRINLVKKINANFKAGNGKNVKEYERSNRTNPKR